MEPLTIGVIVSGIFASIGVLLGAIHCKGKFKLPCVQVDCSDKQLSRENSATSV
jgi:hypothetical protein